MGEKKQFPTGVSGPGFGTESYKKGDYRRAYFKRRNKNKKVKVKKIDLKDGGFGMLSVKYGIDNNPNPTQADRIAGATKGKKPKTADAATGEFMVRGMGAAIRGGKTKGSI